VGDPRSRGEVILPGGKLCPEDRLPKLLLQDTKDLIVFRGMMMSQLKLTEHFPITVD
jgi:hypothetical protein